MRGFYPARITGTSSGIPPARWYPTHHDQTPAVFKRGAPVVATAGEIDECGANPALILGVANEDALSGPGHEPANSSKVLQVTGLDYRTSITMADRQTIFVGELVNGDDVTIAPADADREAEYGITKPASGWAVDKGNANDRVHVVDIDIDNKLVYFKFLVANCQEP